MENFLVSLTLGDLIHCALIVFCIWMLLFWVGGGTFKRFIKPVRPTPSDKFLMSVIEKTREGKYKWTQTSKNIWSYYFDDYNKKSGKRMHLSVFCGGAFGINYVTLYDSGNTILEFNQYWAQKLVKSVVANTPSSAGEINSFYRFVRDEGKENFPK